MKFGTLTIAAVSSMLCAGSALAEGLPLSPSDFSDPGALIPDADANAFITTIGLITEQRPYEPATPLGTALGLDIGIEATVMRIPDSFKAALSDAGVNAASTIPVLPMAKVDIHKGFGDSVDIGGSAILYRGYSVYGGDIKFVVAHPEEGPTWALRFCYANANMGIVSTNTYTPQLLISRKLDFADPYLGVGYSWVTGQINMNISEPPLPGTVNISKSGSGSAFDGFIGVAFRIPTVSILLVMEGSYNSAGADTLGAKFGFSF